ncbi:MAG: hypothetical protein GY841_18970 [FCB group bacterium]|nr:hypothetical protein [FCB group bacterium]
MLSKHCSIILLIISLIIFAISCGDKGVPVDTTTTSLTIVSGDGQIISAGDFLPDSLMVRVVTDKGAPVPDINVLYEQITPLDGDGLTWNGPQVTNLNGYARNKYYANNHIGVDTIQATASNIDDSIVYFVVNVIAGAVDTLDISEGDNQSGTDGQPLAEPCVVFLIDKYDNPISDYRVRFVAQDGCTITTDSTTTAADTAITRTNAAGLASATWIMAPDNPNGYSVLWAQGLSNDVVADSISFSCLVFP